MDAVIAGAVGGVLALAGVALAQLMSRSGERQARVETATAKYLGVVAGALLTMLLVRGEDENRDTRLALEAYTATLNALYELDVIAPRELRRSIRRLDDAIYEIGLHAINSTTTEEFEAAVREVKIARRELVDAARDDREITKPWHVLDPRRNHGSTAFDELAEDAIFGGSAAKST